MEVEYKIQLTHITKVLVQYLHKRVDQLEDDELVLVLVDDGDEVK